MSALKVVAAILLLGNIGLLAFPLLAFDSLPIEFETTPLQVDGTATVVSLDQLDLVADILGLSQLEFLRCLTSRSFGVRSIVTCFYTIAQVSNPPDRMIF
jgi:hypothetical protein